MNIDEFECDCYYCDECKEINCGEERICYYTCYLNHHEDLIENINCFCENYNNCFHLIKYVYGWDSLDLTYQEDLIEYE